MLQIKLNNDKIIDYKEEKSKVFVNSRELEWDIRMINPHQAHILMNNQSYTAEIVRVDDTQKKLTVKINHHTFDIEIRDKYDILLNKLGMSEASTRKIQDLRAPMPGLILDIKVAEGQSVMAGEPLVILEAMKMENIIKASGPGTIKSVKVKTGQSVEKNQILIEF